MRRTHDKLTNIHHVKFRIKYYQRLLFSKSAVYINLFPDISILPDISVDKEYKISCLHEGNTRELIDFHDTYVWKWNYMFSAEDIEKRLIEGHRCFLAHKHQKLVGFMWIAVESVYSTDLLCIFDFPKNCIVSYNNFIRPDCRGENVLPGIRRFAFEEFSKSGYEKCYDYTLISNKSVIKSNQKFNACPIGKITYGYFFGYYFFLPYIGRNEGIEVRLVVDPWHRWRRYLRNKFMKG